MTFGRSVGDGTGNQLRQPAMLVIVLTLGDPLPWCFSNLAARVWIPVVCVFTLRWRAALVYLALCEPDAPVHDLARHRDNTENDAGGISQIVESHHTVVSPSSVIQTTPIVRLIRGTTPGRGTGRRQSVGLHGVTVDPDETRHIS